MVRLLDYIKVDPTDLLNRNKNRTIKNSNKLYYNCAGYALGTFSWYCPIKDDDDDEFFCRLWLSDKEVERSTDYYVEQMLKDFDDLRVIHNIKELYINEYAIAFRVSHDDDFHYIKRARCGHWLHKRGNTPYIERMTEKEVFSDSWYNRYSGRLVLFAKKY